METKLSKLLKILFITIFFISCKGQNEKQQDKVDTSNKVKVEFHNINFFDKKYNATYSLDANNQIPIKSFYDNKTGQFNIFYLGKTKEIQQSWYNFDAKNGLSYEESPDEKYLMNLDKLIDKKLNTNIDDYYIFADYIIPKYIKEKNGELIHTYPLIKKYYLFNNGKWSLIKEVKILSGNENVTTIDFLNELSALLPPNNTESQNSEDKEYQKILLYKYLNTGINKDNISSMATVSKIENILDNYISQTDFYKPSFFTREANIVNNTITEDQLKIWYTCNEKLNFVTVVDENILYDDWRYAFKQITQLKNIVSLYKDKDEEYGHVYKSNALLQQMALYMYFLPWKQRKVIYEEIDQLKMKLKQNQ